MKSPARFVLACALIAFVGCAKSKNDEVNLTPDLKGGRDVVTIPADAREKLEIQEAVAAIEANDQAKLDALLAKNPKLINADPKKVGVEADSLLEVAYFSGDNTSRLSSLIDKGVSPESVWSLRQKIQKETKVNDPHALSMLAGKMFLAAEAKQRKLDARLKEFGLAYGQKNTVENELAAYFAEANELGYSKPYSKESIEALLAASKMAKARVSAPIGLLEEIERSADNFGAILLATEDSTPTHTSLDDRDAVLRKEMWARNELRLRQEAIGKIDHRVSTALTALENLESR